MRSHNTMHLLLSLRIAVTTSTTPAKEHSLAGHNHEAAPECWPGKQIHDPCDGFETGCTLDGILVKCDSDPKTGHMIFSNMCSDSGTPPGTCTCTDGTSHCKVADGDPSCWPGKEIHDPCDGFETGCTVDGILVVCDGDPNTADMIFREDCPSNGLTCACNEGTSSCQQPDDVPEEPACWPGKEIHDPCDGFKTGCTVDEILVKCDGDPKTGNMIFDRTCPASCICVDGVSKCAKKGYEELGGDEL